MRTSRWSSTLALIAALSLCPATTASGAPAFGLKCGASLATLHGALPTDGLIENGWKGGFAAGAWVFHDLGRSFAIQLETNYVSKGTTLGSIEVTDPFGTPIGTFRVSEVASYLEIPVLLRISIPTGGVAAPFFLAGPAAGFRLAQKVRVSGLVGFSADIDTFKAADLGAALGAGLELGRGPVRGTLETRYTLGLTGATEDFYSTDARNGALLFALGVAIRR